MPAGVKEAHGFWSASLVECFPSGPL